MESLGRTLDSSRSLLLWAILVPPHCCGAFYLQQSSLAAGFFMNICLFCKTTMTATIQSAAVKSAYQIIPCSTEGAVGPNASWPPVKLAWLNCACRRLWV